MKNILFAFLMTLPLSARANICGTDYQNFNPTTNGLDFVTVHSSETLQPCVINMGLFLNYAANSLTYSKTLNQNFQSGQKGKDRSLGADLSLGMGINKRWDFGVNVPFILNHTVEDDHYVSSFEENGATEVKANTKFKLLGDERRGLAFILSVNKNLISDNPFAGRGAGPTWNYELAADTTFGSKWAAGFNFGYRNRDPGTPIAGVAFVPMDDQWIYSVAGSYLFASTDTKLILEIFGARPVDKVDQDTDRSLNALEGLVGLKQDWSENLAVHFGAGKQIDSSLGGAEWRVYAGLNWAIGPVCNKPVPVIAGVPPTEPATPEVFTIEAQMLFATDSDQISDAKFDRLDTFFQEVLHRPYKRLVVEGHTDSRGDEKYNQDLSQRRADFVAKYLIDKFKVPADRIESVGHGQSQPVADNGNYQGRQQNRRVEVKIWR